MSASIDATLVIYVTCILLFFLLMFSLINFINHFQFNFECPYIIRDKEVGGIYPTLILLYISIACIVLGLITVLLSYEDPSDVTLSYSYCQRNFSLYTKSPFDFSFMKRKSGNPPSFPLHLVISFLLYMVFVLETYFSFSRYYNVCDIEHRLPLGTSFILYCVLFFVLIWLSITILPIISILFGIFHIFIISYFSYYFNAAVYVSYQHIIDMADFGHTNTYHEMKAQIKQIRQMAIFSVISSIITSVSWYSFALCSNPKQIQILPISLTINSILLFVMFSKNRRFIRNVLHCKGSDIQGACNGPCAMIIERRKQRQWIRDRQKSIFKRIQEGITVSRASKLKVSVSPKPTTLPPSLNNSAADLHGSRTSIEICGDIDPMNDILQKRDDKPRQSLSIQSDISDVFVKMKSIGQTFRHKQHQPHAELADDLKQQVDHGTHSNTTKQVQKKTNRQISFGADMMFDIIKDAIDEEMEDQNTDTKPQFNSKNKLKLFDHVDVNLKIRKSKNPKDKPRLENPKITEITNIFKTNSDMDALLTSLQNFLNEEHADIADCGPRGAMAHYFIHNDHNQLQNIVEKIEQMELEAIGDKVKEYMKYYPIINESKPRDKVDRHALSKITAGSGSQLMHHMLLNNGANVNFACFDNNNPNEIAVSPLGFCLTNWFDSLKGTDVIKNLVARNAKLTQAEMPVLAQLFVKTSAKNAEEMDMHVHFDVLQNIALNSNVS
eukprot:91988_1